MWLAGAHLSQSLCHKANCNFISNCTSVIRNEKGPWKIMHWLLNFLHGIITHSFYSHFIGQRKVHGYFSIERGLDVQSYHGRMEVR